MQHQRSARWLARAGLLGIALLGRAALGQVPNATPAIARAMALQDDGRGGARSVDRAALERLYSVPAATPLWSRGGAATHQAFQAVEFLGAIETRGLRPADYDVDWLSHVIATSFDSDTAIARFDVSLSRAVVRLLADLHMGRASPAAVGFDLPNTHSVDLAAMTVTVSRAEDVAAAISAAEPRYAGYVALERALARYRVFAADTSLRLPRHAPRTIRPGERYGAAARLAHVLTALGDMDTSAATTPYRLVKDSTGAAIFDAVLSDAVARFQRRHGLEADGVIGPATMTQLSIPFAQRRRQIELALERWRWLPDSVPERYAVVNVPAFRLYAFEHDPTASQPVLAMDVIVGQAEGRHGTPVFVSTMQEVVFRPYWDVPASIARKELIPMFRRRPEYFVQEGFEIVRRGDGDVGATLLPATEPNFSLVLGGTLRLRQRPGPANALGPVKFVFPNRYNVFLHGTPAQQLFAHVRRDFSHGCIRIEEPADLAELVLRGQRPWDRMAIEQAMEDGGPTLHVSLARPIVVFVLYATAVVDDSGVLHFYPDLYRHDRALDRVLQSQQPGAG